MTRFNSRIPTMWRRNKVTFFLSVKLLRDHPEDVNGITSRAGGVGRHCFNTCARIHVSYVSTETGGCRLSLI